MEWFANYGHLTADDGSRYAYFLAFVGYDPLEPYLGTFFPHMIFSLTDEDNEKLYSYGSYVKLKNFEQWYASIETNDGDYLRWKGPGKPFQYEIYAKGRDQGVEYTLDLNLDMVKRPLVIEGDGFIRQPEGVSGYYALTRLTIDGYLTINGDKKHVSGIHWIDRQWLGASFAKNNHYTYEWWCIKLDNSEEAILYRIWDINDDTIAAELFEINHFQNDGTREAVTDYSLDNIGYWTSPDPPYYTYSSGWRLFSPACDWDLIIMPTFEEQEASYPFRFWEGSCNVTGTVNGQSVTGVAYAELLYTYSGTVGQGFRYRALPEGVEKVIQRILPQQ